MVADQVPSSWQARSGAPGAKPVRQVPATVLPDGVSDQLALPKLASAEQLVSDRVAKGSRSGWEALERS